MRLYYKIILSLLTVIFVVSASAQAAIYVTKDGQSQITTAPVNPSPYTGAKPAAPGQIAPATPPAATTAPQAATPAPPQQQAQEENINDFAKRYYANCMAKKNPILGPAELKQLCACSAANLVQDMTVENIRTMNEPTAEGLLQRNRMILNVYTPCIQYPARALIMDSCRKNPQVRALPGYERLCGCVSENMGQYVRKEAPAAIAKSLEVNPQDTDPLRAMLESPEFDQASRSYLTSCIVQYQNAKP